MKRIKNTYVTGPRSSYCFFITLYSSLPLSDFGIPAPNMRVKKLKCFNLKKNEEDIYDLLYCVI